MMLAEAVVVLLNGALVEGRRDADTETSRSFMCELFSADANAQGSRVAAVTCHFEDEGRTWARGKLDSPAANALRTVMAIRGDHVICSECGGEVMLNVCLGCGTQFPETSW